MEPGFITFNSIVCDELMPWLEANRDIEKFRLIMRRCRQTPDDKKHLFFRNMDHAFREMGIHLKSEISKEWQDFSGRRFCEAGETLFNWVYERPVNYRIGFYYVLMALLVPAAYTKVQDECLKSDNESYRKYIIMNALKTIHRMLENCSCPETADEESRMLMNRLASVLTLLYLELAVSMKAILDRNLLPLSLRETMEKLHRASVADSTGNELNAVIYATYLPVIFPGKKDSTGKQKLMNSSAVPFSGKNNTEDLKQQAEHTMDALKALAGRCRQGEGNENTVMSRKKEAGEDQPEDEDRLIGSYDACRLLGVGKTTLLEMRRRKELKYTEIGKRYKYSLNEILSKVNLNK